MPFTLSHALAVLPALRADGTGRGRLVPSLLVAGSFSPDMTYFAASYTPGAMEYGDVTHSLPGVLTLDAVISCVLAGLWLVVREPLVALLPRSRQGRTAALLHCGSPRARASSPLAAWWYVSAVLGASTHVTWDAFTHLDRWGMRVFPVLGREFAGSPLYWYLQYGGSAVAGVLLVVFLLRALRRLPRAEPSGVPLLSARDRWWACAVLGGAVAAGVVLRVARWWAYRGGVAEPWEVIPTVCFGAGAGLVPGVLLYAAGVRAWRPVRVARRSGRAGAEPDRRVAR